MFEFLYKLFGFGKEKSIKELYPQMEIPGPKKDNYEPMRFYNVLRIENELDKEGLQNTKYTIIDRISDNRTWIIDTFFPWERGNYYILKPLEHPWQREIQVGDLLWIVKEGEVPEKMEIFNKIEDIKLYNGQKYAKMSMYTGKLERNSGSIEVTLVDKLH